MARKIITIVGRVAAGLAALSMVASAGAASADSRGRHYDRHHSRHHDRGGDIAGAAIVAGVIGLAIGAAIASDDNDRYDRPRKVRTYAPPPPPYGYGYGYAPRPYYDDYGRDCWTTRDYDRRSGAVYERTVCR
ncbi:MULTISPECIES: hypothetical protein [unclassified Caulobacter]|uniref:hypothetical protein n=1 Tax=unclassified Caulobacter TaxID=2648921 RepID=UPI000D356588|nr:MULTISPECIES: hypothetical protein [unclassified Caulobacter]PTS87015.1 hypothetical protein DBR21_13785 [Caulobacter sp. HMWF009]PTT11069.1 hypothetical protein DBR10_04155 [Caulobacter sp. HMWF025]